MQVWIVFVDSWKVDGEESANVVGVAVGGCGEMRKLEMGIMDLSIFLLVASAVFCALCAPQYGGP